MATLRERQDGGFFIVKGYPFRNERREEDMFFRTISVLPRAEQFFAEAGMRDGSAIPKEVFYCLLLDRDITSPKLERAPIRIDDLPREQRYIAEGLAEEHAIISALRGVYQDCRYLAQFYRRTRMVVPVNGQNSKGQQATISLAASLCLARHARQAIYNVAQLLCRL